MEQYIKNKRGEIVLTREVFPRKGPLSYTKLNGKKS